MNYWINVIAKDHVLAGMAGGFTRADGDKAAQLRLLQPGDVIFFYSPGTLFRHGEILQAFTAVARVTGTEASQAQVSPTDRGCQRTVTALSSEEAPASALVSELTFITDKANWTTFLRRSLFQIGEADAQRIAAAMKADLAGQ